MKHIAVPSTGLASPPALTLFALPKRSFHDGPPTPAGSSSLSRQLADREIGFKDLWMDGLQEENGHLEELLENSEGLKAKGTLDALAKLIEDHNKSRKSPLLGYAGTRPVAAGARGAQELRRTRQTGFSSQASFSGSLHSSGSGSAGAGADGDHVPILRFHGKFPPKEIDRGPSDKAELAKQEPKDVLEKGESACRRRVGKGKMNYRNLLHEQEVLEESRAKADTSYSRMIDTYFESQVNAEKSLDALLEYAGRAYSYRGDEESSSRTSSPLCQPTSGPLPTSQLSELSFNEAPSPKGSRGSPEVGLEDLAGEQEDEMAAMLRQTERMLLKKRADSASRGRRPHCLS